MLKIGFCGGFTTFPTYVLESGDLIKNGYMMTAFIYIFLSVIMSVAAIYAAHVMVK